jgi:hypothetical protein
MEMRLTKQLLMLVMLSTVMRCALLHPAVKIYKASFAGPFNSGVLAYGNFDIS